jgi:acetyl esterase/lipase
MKYFLFIFIIVLNFSCEKIEKKEVTKGANISTAASPVRFKDVVFSVSELFNENNILYRKAASDFAPGDSIRRNLALDFYCPSFGLDTMVKRPLIILVHGGSFYQGSKSSNIDVCQTFAQHGYAVASIDYRLDTSFQCKINTNTLLPQEFFVALYRSVQDTRFAIRYLKQSYISNLGRIDTNRIFLTGISAGAITALHTAYLDDNEIPPSFINQTLLGKLDYNSTSGIIPASAAFTTAIAFAGALVSPGDNLVFIDYGYGLFQSIPLYGGREVIKKLTALQIPNAFKRFDDRYNPAPPYPYTHGSLAKAGTNDQLNPEGIQFVTDNLFYAFYYK